MFFKLFLKFGKLLFRSAGDSYVEARLGEKNCILFADAIGTASDEGPPLLFGWRLRRRPIRLSKSLSVSNFLILCSIVTIVMVKPEVVKWQADLIGAKQIN
jgi:hypothetical protein